MRSPRAARPLVSRLGRRRAAPGGRGRNLTQRGPLVKQDAPRGPPSRSGVLFDPPRLGGWRAADLAHFAHCVGPYRCFPRGERPDWERIAERTAGRTTTLIVADLREHLRMRRPD